MLYSSWSVAIALSLLLHLLLLALLLLPPAPAPVKNTVKAAPLTVQIINWPQPNTSTRATTSKEDSKTLVTSSPMAAEQLKANHSAEAAPISKPAVPKNDNIIKTATTALTTPKPNTAHKQSTQQAKPQLSTAETAPVKPGLADRILATVTARQQQLATELSSAEVQALQQKTTPDKAISVVRSGPKPSYAADNVLAVLNDGSFVEKIGDYCYQAKAGADIRRDISSMKPVTCGDDANEALYHRIMDKVGKNRR